MHLECRYAQDMHCAYHVCMFQLNTYKYIQYIHALSDTYMICTCRLTDARASVQVARVAWVGWIGLSEGDGKWAGWSSGTAP